MNMFLQGRQWVAIEVSFWYCATPTGLIKTYFNYHRTPNFLDICVVLIGFNKASSGGFIQTLNLGVMKRVFNTVLPPLSSL